MLLFIFDDVWEQGSTKIAGNSPKQLRSYHTQVGLQILVILAHKDEAGFPAFGSCLCKGHS